MDLHIVLFQPEIPQNTGAIGRVCVALDATLHLIGPLGFDLDEKKLRRAGMDYWSHVNIRMYDSWEDFREKENPTVLYATTAHAEHTHFEPSYDKTTYLLFGPESTGLPAEIIDTCQNTLITIPMPGAHARSHNIANAVSIVAYEVYRQLMT